ncbi:hypothetical protein [Shimia sp. R9_3]|uniref:hypothetical protein n=1 Tax=Shimia sp. R9_3 TaxID=2821113 RepID=UPI001ADC3A6F|nr:hypothetical protein [Shimia sp. R9_3]MBO9401887.1 hypothetical protein [Shimia sp. R9_3]
MMEAVALAVSSCLTHLATNLDNLVVMLGLALTTARFQVIAGYMLAQVLVLAIAFLVAEHVDTELPLPVGCLGLVPIGLGLWGIGQNRSAADVDGQMPVVKANTMALTVLFLSLSFDTFVVFTPLLADSRAVYSAPVLGGALISALVVAAIGAAGAGIAPSRIVSLQKLEGFAPYVMIAVGLYVVLNTATDAI